MIIRSVRSISRKGQVSSSGSSALSTAKVASRSRWCETPGVDSAGKSSTSSQSPKRHHLRPFSNKLLEFFGCGTIIKHNRHDDHRYRLMRYAVKRRSDLSELIILFFEEHPLRTTKQNDFKCFCKVISMMRDDLHLTHTGLVEIARITETMNRKQRSRYLESSEAIRQPPLLDSRGEDMVRAP